jgi:hypothetical protein
MTKGDAAGQWGRILEAAATYFLWCQGEKKLFFCFLNFDVGQGGSLSGRPICSRRFPRVGFLF